MALKLLDGWGREDKYGRINNQKVLLDKVYVKNGIPLPPFFWIGIESLCRKSRIQCGLKSIGSHPVASQHGNLPSWNSPFAASTTGCRIKLRR
jgi:hypothetical protein